MKESKGNIWVTGASSGIGKETAKEFARIGCNVVVSSRRHSVLELINKELAAENLSVNVVPCNIASSSNVELAVKKIYELGPIDCLINNAGITSFKKVEENSIREIKDIVEVNLLGSIFCIKTVLPKMIEKKKGTIINILSVAAEKLFTQSSAYSASKAGLLAYTNVLREEVRNYNIKIVNILPGATNTGMWANSVIEEFGERMMLPEEIARLIVSIYLQDRNLVTEEIVVRPLIGDL
ncbi:MAG: SDR family NAD(P)-dependent oxidoreductase [Ignavibacteriales bacterium]|nr:SDR family NAD(P)-dependent oxidoreductase [Ignavibacteriales bacterium]